MAKAPRPGTATANTRKGLLVGFGSERWVLHASGITPKDVADLRRATGLGTQQVFAAIASGEIDLDVAGALIFLARRQSEGRWMNYETATAGLSYTTEFHMAAEGSEQNGDGSEGGDDDDPEA